MSAGSSGYKGHVGPGGGWATVPHLPLPHPHPRQPRENFQALSIWHPLAKVWHRAQPQLRIHSAHLQVLQTLGLSNLRKLEAGDPQHIKPLIPNAHNLRLLKSQLPNVGRGSAGTEKPTPHPPSVLCGFCPELSEPGSLGSPRYCFFFFFFLELSILRIYLFFCSVAVPIEHIHKSTGDIWVAIKLIFISAYFYKYRYLKNGAAAAACFFPEVPGKLSL